MSQSTVKTLARTVLAALCLSAFAAGCASSVEYIPGTKVVRTRDNETLIERVEAYRMAVEHKDAAALLLMASKTYWDDGGTPAGDDDYGYDGLQKLLAGRFQQADAIRYAMRYVGIHRQGDRAFVDVIVDASFSIKDARGQELRQDMRDQNQLVLEWDGSRWMFVSGM
jgi:hypothetical protein